VRVCAYTRMGRGAHLPSVAGDNSSGNVIPTPACACTQEKYFQDEFPRSAAATAVYGTLYYTRSSPAEPPRSLTLFVYIYIYIYKYTHTQPLAHTCCREILQNFNMIYPARVIYLSGFSYSVRAEIKLDSTGAVCRHRARRSAVARGGFGNDEVCGARPRKLFSPAVLKNIAHVGRVVRFVLSA